MIYHEKKQALQLLSQFHACHFPFALWSRFIPYISRKNPSSFNLPIWPQGLTPLCSEYLVSLSRVVPPCLLPWWGSPRRCRLPLSPEIEGSITVLLLFRLLEASKAYCSALFNTQITALLSSFSPKQLIQGGKWRSPCTAGVFHCAHLCVQTSAL